MNNKGATPRLQLKSWILYLSAGLLLIVVAFLLATYRFSATDIDSPPDVDAYLYFITGQPIDVDGVSIQANLVYFTDTQGAQLETFSQTCPQSDNSDPPLDPTTNSLTEEVIVISIDKGSPKCVAVGSKISEKGVELTVKDAGSAFYTDGDGNSKVLNLVSLAKTINDWQKWGQDLLAILFHGYWRGARGNRLGKKAPLVVCQPICAGQRPRSLLHCASESLTRHEYAVGNSITTWHRGRPQSASRRQY